MMILAQDMGMDGLKNTCEDHVISTLSVANACTFLAAVMDIQEKASGNFNLFYKIKYKIYVCAGHIEQKGMVLFINGLLVASSYLIETKADRKYFPSHLGVQRYVLEIKNGVKRINCMLSQYHSIWYMGNTPIEGRRGPQSFCITIILFAEA